LKADRPRQIQNISGLAQGPSLPARARHQHEDRQGAQPRDSRNIRAARRRGDRM